MSTKTLGYLSSILFRLYLNLKQKFENKQPIADEEKICIEICTQLIKYPETELTYSPKTVSRYINNEEKKIFVSIQGKVLHLINSGGCGYTIWLDNDESYTKLTTLFDDTIEKRTSDVEQKMKSEVQHSLQNILSGI